MALPVVRVGETGLTVTIPSKKAQRAAAVAARSARITQIAQLISNLVDSHSAYSIPAGFSPDKKHQGRLDKIAEHKKAFVAKNVALLKSTFDSIFKKDETSGVRTEINDIKRFKNVIRSYNRVCNYFNQRSAEFRKLSDADAAKLALFEQIIRDNVFPSYDHTNGLETDADTKAHVDALMHPTPAKIVCKLDETVIDLADEDESFPLGYFILKGSRRTTIVATQEEISFKGAIEYLISNALLVSDHDVRGKHVGKRFLADFSKTNGAFFDYYLQFDFEHSKMYSTSVEMMLRMTTTELLKWYNIMCKRRIIQMILARDKSVEYHDKLVFCQTPECIHADGFMYNMEPNMHRSHASCPAGHAFCIICNRAEHSSLCAELDDDSHAVALLPGHKLCPTCKTAIFKNGGCNHMQCGTCNQNFCWLCSRRFTASEQYVAHDGCSQFD